jgi:hypothetical protein
MNPIPFATLGLSLLMSPALAQTQPSPATSVPPATETATKAAFGVLPGRWVRVQGGYVITINSVDADGRLDASYADPRPLPFTRPWPPATATALNCSLSYAPSATTVLPIRSAMMRRMIG